MNGYFGRLSTQAVSSQSRLRVRFAMPGERGSAAKNELDHPTMSQRHDSEIDSFQPSFPRRTTEVSKSPGDPHRFLPDGARSLSDNPLTTGEVPSITQESLRSPANAADLDTAPNLIENEVPTVNREPGTQASSTLNPASVFYDPESASLDIPSYQPKNLSRADQTAARDRKSMPAQPEFDRLGLEQVVSAPSELVERAMEAIQEGPVVKVTIGRLEVGRPSGPAGSVPPNAPNRKVVKRMELDEFLANRAKERR